MKSNLKNKNKQFIKETRSSTPDVDGILKEKNGKDPKKCHSESPAPPEKTGKIAKGLVTGEAMTQVHFHSRNSDGVKRGSGLFNMQEVQKGAVKTNSSSNINADVSLPKSEKTPVASSSTKPGPTVTKQANGTSHETKLLNQNNSSNGYHAIIEVDDDDVAPSKSKPIRHEGNAESSDGGEEGDEDNGNAEDRSFKLHNIWAKFETGQVDNVQTKKKLSAEIKELRSDILKMKMSKLTNENQGPESVSQNKLDEIEQEKMQELEEIKKARHANLLDIREKFQNFSEKGDDTTPSPKPLDLDLAPEEREDSHDVVERKSLLESFKKRLEQGDLEGNQKIDKSEELSQLKTNTSLIREKILAAQSEDSKPVRAAGRRLSTSPPPGLDVQHGQKVEYVSEPRDPVIPNLVRPKDEISEVETEINQLRNQAAGSARMFKERFEQISTKGADVSPSGNGGNQDIISEIQRLRAEAGDKSEFVSEGSPLAKDVVRATDLSHGDLIDANSPFASTKNRIAKFKELEKGINPENENDENRVRKQREITPPRDGKVVFENDPKQIDDPNYVRGSSLTPNEQGELWQGRESARNLKEMFEQIPHEEKESFKERPRVKRFTDPKIIIPDAAPEEFCVFCDQKVYPTDKMDFNKKSIHRGCFKCKFCKGILRLENYATHENEVYCVPHFKMLFANEPGLTQAHKNFLNQQK